MEDITKGLKPVLDLNRFFNIPDGEEVDYTLIDENGSDYDLQIIYSGKKFSSEILCNHEGYYTNKHGLKLYENPVSFPKARKAETHQDFQLIFDREFEKQKAENKNIFKQWLAEYFTSYLLQPVKDNFLKTQYRNIELSEVFLLWLRGESASIDLSYSELALKYIYLEKGKIEPYITGSQVGIKYSHLKNAKNIEKAYNDFINKRRTPNIKQLRNIHDALSDYPNVQKAIENDMDKL